VVVNASRLYFTGIETSPVGPLFQKMDEITNRKHVHQAEQSPLNAENPAETLAEQQP
jgi:Cu+-exporting ATPase